VTLKLAGTVKDAASGEAVTSRGGAVTLDLYPFQLRAFHAE
jgi:hypothetical protein